MKQSFFFIIYNIYIFRYFYFLFRENYHHELKISEKNHICILFFERCINQWPIFSNIINKKLNICVLHVYILHLTNILCINVTLTTLFAWIELALSHESIVYGFIIYVRKFRYEKHERTRMCIQDTLILNDNVDRWNVINLLIVNTIFALSTLSNDVRVKRDST